MDTQGIGATLLEPETAYSIAMCGNERYCSERAIPSIVPNDFRLSFDPRRTRTRGIAVPWRIRKIDEHELITRNDLLYAADAILSKSDCSFTRHFGPNDA